MREGPAVDMQHTREQTREQNPYWPFLGPPRSPIVISAQERRGWSAALEAPDRRTWDETVAGWGMSADRADLEREIDSVLQSEGMRTPPVTPDGRHRSRTPPRLRDLEDLHEREEWAVARVYRSSRGTAAVWQGEVEIAAEEEVALEPAEEDIVAEEVVALAPEERTASGEGGGGDRVGGEGGRGP
jgi:hypothetical protein